MKDYPTIHPELTWRLLDGEAVIVSPTSGEIRVLNQVGTIIWQLLADGITTEEIALALTNQFDISSEQAKTDVASFLEDLYIRGLLI